MTELEAARILDPETTRDELLEFDYEERLELCNEACRIAANVLRSMEDNPPLTLEQLREMDGEPVWVVFLDGSGSERLAIVRAYGKDPEDLECYTPQYERLPGWTYGARGDHGWRAYRRKLEEGTT